MNVEVITSIARKIDAEHDEQVNIGVRADLVFVYQNGSTSYKRLLDMIDNGEIGGGGSSPGSGSPVSATLTWQDV